MSQQILNILHKPVSESITDYVNINLKTADSAEILVKEENEFFLEHKRGKKDIKTITDCPHTDRKHYAKVYFELLIVEYVL
jgi:hypothetical protein